MNNKKIGLISLGCDKNRVDSEKCLALAKNWFQITNDISEANIIVINSCAFLEASRVEAINTVLEVNELRENGVLEKIVLTGCLPQKFINELFDELIEVDVFLGYLDYDLLYEALQLAYKGERVNYVDKKHSFSTIQRVQTTPSHYAYLKIADGCDNKCTYCLIPKIRGKYYSTPIEQLIEETKQFGELSELILVAQDITKYGVDIYGKPSLVRLIKELSKLETVKRIRLLYCYPDIIDDDLIYEIKNNEKVIKYIDVPLQHASNSVLKRMNRKGSYESYLALINRMRMEIPQISIRSTFITGFPGETEEDFNTLVKFIKQAKLTNCGFFAYSREEGTPAYKLPNQIDEEIKQKRVKKLYSVQKNISKKYLLSFVGKQITVVCDGIDFENDSFFGHGYYNCPDIDGKIYIVSKDTLMQGEEYTILIKQNDNYDLYGEVVL